MKSPGLTDILLEEAEEAIALDDVGRARECYRRVLAMEPGHPIATLALQEFARGAEVTREAEVSLTCDPGDELLPTELFILSQLTQHPTPVARIVNSGNVPEPAVLLVLKVFAQRGVVAVH